MVRRRDQRSTQVPAGRPNSSQGSQLAAVSRATMAVLACRVDTATSGRATVVIAEPNPLTDSPTQNKPKFRVRSRPPTGLRLAAGMRSAAASGHQMFRACRRRHHSRYRASVDGTKLSEGDLMDKTASPATCQACGRDLPEQKATGRSRRYCNATCRSSARRERERAGTAVKSELTTVPRHAYLDTIGSFDSSSEPQAVALLSAAAQLATELDRPGAGSLGAVGAARELAGAANAALQVAVDQARANGHSWQEIGDALNTTRQAAFQRFGRPVDPRTGTPMTRTALPGAAERAAAIFADMAEGRWEEARRDFGERMREGLDADRLASGWVHTVSLIGAFERMGEPSARAAGEHTIVDIPLYFEAGEANGRVTLDGDAEVVGLFIRPVREGMPQ
jgi:hypothetical protein